MQLTVLILDDDSSQHLLIRKTLNPLGITTISSYHVQQAIDELYRNKVNLIISDIHMDGIDGISFLSLIKKDINLANIPFIILSGDPSIEVQKNASELGALFYLQKPFLLNDLINVVHNFAAFKDLYSPPNNVDTFYLRKKQKLITNLVRDSLGRNRDVAIENLLDNTVSIYDFNALYLFKKSTDNGYIQKKSICRVNVSGVPTKVKGGTFDSIDQMLRLNQIIVRNDAFKSNNTIASFVKTSEPLVCEVLIPLNECKKMNLISAQFINTTSELSGFLWGFRNSFFSTDESESIEKLFSQAIPIICSIKE